MVNDREVEAIRDGTENRLLWVDFLRNIGIMFVVWGHFLPQSLIRTLIYSFHVPLFFILSGFLVERISKGRRKLKFVGLLLPYAIWTVISLVLLGLLGRMATNNKLSMEYIVYSFIPIRGFVCWNAPLWFLYVLFIVRILTPSLDEWRKLFCGKIVWPCIVIVLMLGTCRALDSCKGINILAYRQIGLGCFFYTVGMCVSRWRVDEWFFRERFKLFVVFMMGVACAFLNGSLSIWAWSISRLDLLVGSSFGICMFLFVVCRRFCKMPLARVFNVRHGGVVFILCSHCFLVSLWRRICPHELQESIVVATCITFFVLCLYLLSYKVIEKLRAIFMNVRVFAAV